MEALLHTAALLAVFAAPALAEKPSIMFILSVSLSNRRHNPMWAAVFSPAVCRSSLADWPAPRSVGHRMTSGITRWDS